MHLTTRNVNSGFKTLVELFWNGSLSNGETDGVRFARRSSRYGDVMVIDEPVTITYTHPLERVLFNQARDANPFFTLYESLWMLAGRNDVAPLAFYNSRMPEFSDDGETLNGAYGYRWRHGLELGSEQESRQYTYREAFHSVDQIKVIINHLKADPDSRRAVLQMWTVEDDLLKIEESKDVCCNLSVLFSLRSCFECQGTGNCPYPEMASTEKHCPCCRGSRLLDITILNRSNDLIWGLLGTNYVQFTILQEYVAAHLGVGVGKYHHFTNNLHAYDKTWKAEEWLLDEKDTVDVTGYGYGDAYANLRIIPLVRDPETFDRELPEFVETHSKYAGITAYSEPFLVDADMLLRAFHRYKIKEYEGAMDAVHNVKADDWRIAATNWLEKRLAKKVEAKS